MLQQIAPYIGYLASLCLILGLLAKTELYFRIFSATGCTCFIIYAIILNAIPVLITNGTLFCINIYYLRKLLKKKEFFDLIEFKGEEKMIDRFFQYYQQDITGYFPKFQKNMLENNLNFAILRDLVIANIFSARLTENGDAEVSINYTLQKYRDYKVGNFLFQREKEYLLSKGIKRIVYRRVSNKNHLHFLKKMGFMPETVGEETFWVKAI
ncbi:MAG TPA: YgjV family protein [Ferruginibacter sp.]|mgnify:FL=1|nr:YgjV family protein [Ferruginibacter sp.]MBS1924768.1 YgjV family protein [Bacteroidota bacterium]HMT97056.1 YgjV family protein [Ferruginibacter sp.]HMU24240.1 YgjV family protein [Ferruginibacter sp.]